VRFFIATALMRDGIRQCGDSRCQVGYLKARLVPKSFDEVTFQFLKRLT
jgi:hypothetical protein